MLQAFPDRRCNPGVAARCNQALTFEFENVRDLLLLHYTRTERAQTEFRHYNFAGQNVLPQHQPFVESLYANALRKRPGPVISN